ncbi:MAG: acyl-CoA carboxylase subunit beta [Saccharofermentanales bacterium]
MGSRETMTEFLQQNDSQQSGQGISPVCRARLDALLDADSFVQLDAHVKSRGIGSGFEREAIEGDGVVTGYGTVDGRLVYVAVQDPTVHGGSLGQVHAAKISKAISFAASARAPFVGVYDSGGSRIEEGIAALEGLGDVIGALHDASGEVPLIAAVVGPCAGGLAMAAAASDFVLMSEDKGAIFMNGPMVIAATEGNSVDVAAIGGAGVHSVSTGLAAITAADEQGVMDKLKVLLAYLPDSSEGFAFAADAYDDPNRTEARLDEIAASLDDGYDMSEVLNLVVDTESFLPLAAAFAPEMITGLGMLGGITVGIIANNGKRLDAKMNRKAERFVQFCERFNIPLISFVDAAGFAIGSAHEAGDLVDSAAALTRTFFDCTVPRISVIVGDAYGTAYLALNSRSTGADLVYAWPTAEIAVTSSDTAAHILYRKDIAAAADPATARKEFSSRYAREVAAPSVAASYGHVDEIIKPSATRPRLVSALDMLIAAY